MPRIRDIPRFLYRDIKRDVLFMKELFTYRGDAVKKAKMEAHLEKKRQQLSGGWGKAFSDNWNWFIIILAALVVGSLVSSQYWENKCNAFIIEYEESFQARPEINLSGSLDTVMPTMDEIIIPTVEELNNGQYNS